MAQGDDVAGTNNVGELLCVIPDIGANIPHDIARQDMAQERVLKTFVVGDIPTPTVNPLQGVKSRAVARHCARTRTGREKSMKACLQEGRRLN